MNCWKCGRFMTKQLEADSPFEDEVLQLWSCKEHGMYPEHLYFKSSIKSDSLRLTQDETKLRMDK